MPNSSPLAQQYQLASLKTLEMNNLEPNRVGSILSEKCGLPAATHSNELNAKGIISMSLPRIDDENHNSRKELVSGAGTDLFLAVEAMNELLLLTFSISDLQENGRVQAWQLIGCHHRRLAFRKIHR